MTNDVATRETTAMIAYNGDWQECTLSPNEITNAISSGYIFLLPNSDYDDGLLMSYEAVSLAALNQMWAMESGVVSASDAAAFAKCSRCGIREADMTTADGVASCSECATENDAMNANAAPDATEVTR